MLVVRISPHRTLCEYSHARAGTSHAGAARTAEAVGGWRALQGPEHVRFVDKRTPLPVLGRELLRHEATALCLVLADAHLSPPVGAC
jgi:hypothetical protein